jgi:hypothetical protein
MDVTRFYGPADNLPLGAGLLVRDCILAFPHVTEQRFETGVGPALVLTHECDVDPANDRHFNDLFLACPIMLLDDFCEGLEAEEGTGAWGGILPQLASDTVVRAMYLPPVPPIFRFPEMDGGGVIYLNHISSCRVVWIPDLLQQAVCSLSAIGLQYLDAKLQNLLFREKTAPLWFNRG